MRRLADSSIAWLDFGAVFTNEFIVKITLAVDDLSAAIRTSLNITAEDVELSFAHAAIVTWLAICFPLLFLLPVTIAVVILAADPEGCGYAFFCHESVNLTTIRRKSVSYFAC